MGDFRHAMKTVGYDQEEAYFHQKDRELIEKMREAQKKEGSPPQEGGKVIQLETGRVNQDLSKKKAA